MVVVDGGRSFVASEEEEGSSCREKAGDDLRRLLKKRFIWCVE
jgi:hypothetical protein